MNDLNNIEFGIMSGVSSKRETPKFNSNNFKSLTKL